MAGFALPLAGSAAREAMGDLAHVAEILDRANLSKMTPFDVALSQARRGALHQDGVKYVCMIVLRGDDERWLVKIGRRGGWRRLWNFGTGR